MHNNRHNKGAIIQRLIGIILGAIAWLGASEYAAAQVDCDSGGILQNEIGLGAQTIVFTGDCDEDVVIISDGVTLLRTGTGSASVDSTGVGGATNVVLRNFTVDGVAGMTATNGAFVFVRFVNVSGARVNISQNSGMDMRSTTVTGP